MKYFLAKAARRGAAIVFFLILGIIVFHFVFRRPERFRDVSEPGKTETSVAAVDRQEGVEYVLFKGDKGKIKVRADRFYVSDNQINHLEGNVVVVDYGRKGGRETVISGDRIDYDQNLSHFEVFGRAQIREKDALLESTFFDYNKEKEIFSTDRGVAFSSSRLKARSRSLTYKQAAEKLDLEGDLFLEIRPKLETDQSLSVVGDRLFYRRKSRTGRIEGNVKITHGQSHGTAASLLFILSKDEQEVRTLVLEEEARVTFEKKNGQGASGAEQQIEADVIRLGTSLHGSKINRVKAKGNCNVSLSVAGGRTDRVRAKFGIFFFDKQGGLRDFQAGGGAQLIIGGGQDGGERRIWGNKVKYKKKTEALSARGKEKTPARIESGRSNLEANSAVINLKSGDMQASGAVKLILKADKTGNAVGFFSKDMPVFVTCLDLAYAGDKKRFLFKDEVRLWQEKDIIRAKEFEILENSGEMKARGEVKADFTQKPKDKPGEERLSIKAAEMSYVPEDKRILFRGGCTLNTSAVTLTSANLDVRLKKTGNEIDKLLAREKVIIIQQLKEGRGEKADYDLTTETMILTGNPVLVEKDKGMTEGDKLTFYLADGRIIIENKERETSATVIK